MTGFGVALRPGPGGDVHRAVLGVLLPHQFDHIQDHFALGVGPRVQRLREETGFLFLALGNRPRRRRLAHRAGLSRAHDRRVELLIDVPQRLGVLVHARQVGVGDGLELAVLLPDTRFQQGVGVVGLGGLGAQAGHARLEVHGAQALAHGGDVPDRHHLVDVGRHVQEFRGERLIGEGRVGVLGSPRGAGIERRMAQRVIVLAHKDQVRDGAGAVVGHAEVGAGQGVRVDAVIDLVAGGDHHAAHPLAHVQGLGTGRHLAAVDEVGIHTQLLAADVGQAYTVRDPLVLHVDQLPVDHLDDDLGPGLAGGHIQRPRVGGIEAAGQAVLAALLILLG